MSHQLAHKCCLWHTPSGCFLPLPCGYL